MVHDLLLGNSTISFLTHYSKKDMKFTSPCSIAWYRQYSEGVMDPIRMIMTWNDLFNGTHIHFA